MKHVQQIRKKWDLFITGGLYSWSKAFEETKTPLQTLIVLLLPFISICLLVALTVGVYFLVR